MKNTALLVLIILVFIRCSSDSNISENELVNEDKVVAYSEGGFATIGVTTGKVYKSLSYNSGGLFSYCKQDDKLYALFSNDGKVFLQTIDAEQLRGQSPDLQNVNFSSVEVAGTEDMLLGNVFFDNNGNLDVIYHIQSDLYYEFGIGRIDKITGTFHSLYNGLICDGVSALLKFNYNTIDNCLYYFETNPLSLESKINLATGQQEFIHDSFGASFYYPMYYGVFQTNIDQDFYFVGGETVSERSLYRFDCSSSNLIGLGLLPTNHNIVGRVFFNNSKNTAYYTSYYGSSYSICTYNYTSNVKTEVFVELDSPLGFPAAAEQLLYID